MTTTNGTALAVVKQDSGSLAAFEPRSTSEAYQVASYYAKTGLLGDLNTPEKVFLVMATGAELGIPMTAALRAVHVVKGKPIVSAQLLVALCQRRRDVCRYFRIVETTDERAVYETHREGEPTPTRMQFTMADAERAGLKSGDNYRKYPATMLRHRCAANLARAVYPDLVLGLYVEEERDEVAAEAPLAAAVEPLSVQVAEVDFAARYAAAVSLDEIATLDSEARAANLGVEAKRAAVAARKIRKAELEAAEQPEPGSEG